MHASLSVLLTHRMRPWTGLLWNPRQRKRHKCLMRDLGEYWQSLRARFARTADAVHSESGWRTYGANQRGAARAARRSGYPAFRARRTRRGLRPDRGAARQAGDRRTAHRRIRPRQCRQVRARQRTARTRGVRDRRPARHDALARRAALAGSRRAGIAPDRYARHQRIVRRGTRAARLRRRRDQRPGHLRRRRRHDAVRKLPHCPPCPRPSARCCWR